LLLLILLVQPVYSTSLGSFSRKDTIIINAGESENIEVLFWNSGNKDYLLKISENYIPFGWVISIKPNNFLLNIVEPANPPFDEGRYINLPNIGVIKPIKVEVKVNTPRNTRSGEYILRFTAIAYNPNNEISVLQENDINFRVKIIGGLEKQEVSTIENISSSNEILEKPMQLSYNNLTGSQEGKETNINNTTNNQTENEKIKNPLTAKIALDSLPFFKNNILVILLSFAIILFFSVVIYKYA